MLSFNMYQTCTSKPMCSPQLGLPNKILCWTYLYEKLFIIYLKFKFNLLFLFAKSGRLSHKEFSSPLFPCCQINTTLNVLHQVKDKLGQQGEDKDEGHVLSSRMNASFLPELLASGETLLQRFTFLLPFCLGLIDQQGPSQILDLVITSLN